MITGLLRRIILIPHIATTRLVTRIMITLITDIPTTIGGTTRTRGWPIPLSFSAFADIDLEILMIDFTASTGFVAGEASPFKAAPVWPGVPPGHPLRVDLLTAGLRDLASAAVLSLPLVCGPEVLPDAWGAGTAAAIASRSSLGYKGVNGTTLPG